MEKDFSDYLICQYTEFENGISSFHSIEQGYLSQNFRIESSGKKYFLKKYRFNERRRWDKSQFHKTADSVLAVIDGLKEMSEFDQRARKALVYKRDCVKRETLDFVDMEGLRVGLTHGDYHDGNVFFDFRGNVTYVFDLEKTCIGPFCFEIIRAIHYSKILKVNQDMSRISTADFLSG